MSHIEIKKVIEKNIPFEMNGVRNPLMDDAKIEVKEEVICLSEIRSFRPWFKNKNQGYAVEEDMTILYMKINPIEENQEDDSKKKANNKKPAHIIIAENYKSFLKRSGTIPLEQDED